MKFEIDEDFLKLKSSFQNWQRPNSVFRFKNIRVRIWKERNKKYVWCKELNKIAEIWSNWGG